MGRLDGKTVMVTGAGTGFGAELAVKAAQEGAARVVVHYRTSQAGAEETAARVRAAGAEAALVQGDISRGTTSSGWPGRRATSTCWSTTSATWPPTSTAGAT